MVFRYAAKFMKMDMNQVLARDVVRMRDPIAAKATLKTLIEAGAGRLQIITDFDHTISKSRKSNGEFNCTTHRIFHAVADGVDPKLKEALAALTEKYYPIEMDPLLSNEEKVPHMKAWWERSHDLIVRAGFGKAMLERYVREANVQLRDGFLEFLQLAEADGVPIVLFSAGIGDVIEIIIRQQYGRIPDNVHIISNMMKFNEEDRVIEFVPPLIHTFNKNRSVIQSERRFFEHLRGRPNVLMLGDTLGDLNMDVGVVNEGVIVKIGFLNNLIEASMPAYLDGYDIVLADDQTFEIPLGILKSLIAHEKKEETAMGGSG